MPAVVVLGMHRSGTSLVASMLDAMGVDMGAEQMGASIGQPFGHWEDLDFVRMNDHVIGDNAGTWDDPQEIDFRKAWPEVAMLATTKAHPELTGSETREPGAWWGWKDPRNCLTVGVYHQYLDNPHYVVVDRSRDAVIASLEWREGKAGDHWGDLYDLYIGQRECFLTAVNAPALRLRYESIVIDALNQAQLIAAFLGMGRAEARKAAVVVKPRSLEIPQEYVVNLSRTQVGAPNDGIRIVNVRAEGREFALTHGLVHGLIVGKTADPEEIQGWAAKVRPGGKVYGVHRGRYQDWPDTTWQRYGSNRKRKPYLQRGDPWGTIGIGVPYFKAGYEFWRWWSWMLLEGLEPGDVLLNDETVNAPEPIPVIFNRLIARFLETDRDTLCIVEDDHVGDHDVIRRMREKPANRDFDIVTANYVNRRADPFIVGYDLAPKRNRHGEYICAIDHANVWKTGTQPVGGSAMGLVLIRRWVLDAMLAGGNPANEQWVEWKAGNSQDIQFYGRAREVGARVGVDRDANIGHMAGVVRTVEDFWRAREGTQAMREGAQGAG